MSVDVACAYLGSIGREAFLSKVAPHLGPPKLIDGTARYDRRDLDAWVDSDGKGLKKRSDADWLQEIRDA
jgi:hypothetical protein